MSDDQPRDPEQPNLREVVAGLSLLALLLSGNQGKPAYLAQQAFAYADALLKLRQP